MRPATGRWLQRPRLSRFARDATAQYDREVDEAGCALPEHRETMCVVPLKDHFGRVIGLLQAVGKQGKQARRAGEGPQRDQPRPQAHQRARRRP